MKDSTRLRRKATKVVVLGKDATAFFKVDMDGKSFVYVNFEGVFMLVATDKLNDQDLSGLETEKW